VKEGDLGRVGFGGKRDRARGSLGELEGRGRNLIIQKERDNHMKRSFQERKGRDPEEKTSRSLGEKVAREGSSVSLKAGRRENHDRD